MGWRMIRTAFAFLCSAVLARAAQVFVEAESFASHGGWTLDTQFIEIMGPPYLLAHGIGTPVKDAEAEVAFREAGEYHVFVRTKDWVSPWKAEGAPGKFQVLVNGTALSETFGTTGDWHWQKGGTVRIAAAGAVKLALRDLTGFDGRCDALYFTTDSAAAPPATREERRKLTQQPAQMPESAEYDLVVIGGGYSGMGAAIAASRQGLKVALLQNRPVLGGNGSSEIQVWAMGGTRRGPYPALGEIVEEFADRATNSPGTIQEYGDAKKEAIVRAERNIDLLLNHHAIAVEMGTPPADDHKVIRSVTALDTRTGAEKKFRAKLFADCTGHGTIGALAGGSFTMLEKGHMGMSNLWSWKDAVQPVTWPQTPWALPLEWGDFPPTKKSENSADTFHKGEWFWETGFDKHPINDLELMRDWNLRAVFGAFSAMKHGAQRERYATAQLAWVAAIGGTRESRMLTGDVVLTDKDIVEKREFPDACVPTTWDLDLHYPKEQFAKKFPDNPFISRAQFGKGVDRQNGYPVPYRCFYSKDVDNLFMAGRCISVTHEALGTVRVMRTCGMMGEVVGKAAYVAVKRKTTPRGVYQSHLDELKDLWRQPGLARRESLDGPLAVPAGAKAPATYGPGNYGPPKPAVKLDGIVVDDTQAKFTGEWGSGDGLKGFIGSGYRYAAPGAKATAVFAFKVPSDGRYEVRYAVSPHENRAAAAVCTVNGAEQKLNLKVAPSRQDGFESLGTFALKSGAENTVTLSTEGADGFLHADAVWVVPAGK
jgi:hypothetical protein